MSRPVITLAESSFGGGSVFEGRALRRSRGISTVVAVPRELGTRTSLPDTTFPERAAGVPERADCPHAAVDQPLITTAIIRGTRIGGPMAVRTIALASSLLPSTIPRRQKGRNAPTATRSSTTIAGKPRKLGNLTAQGKEFEPSTPFGTQRFESTQGKAQPLPRQAGCHIG